MPSIEKTRSVIPKTKLKYSYQWCYLRKPEHQWEGGWHVCREQETFDSDKSCYIFSCGMNVWVIRMCVWVPNRSHSSFYFTFWLSHGYYYSVFFKGGDSKWQFHSTISKKFRFINLGIRQGLADIQCRDNDSTGKVSAEYVSQETVNLSHDRKGYPESADVSNIYIRCA